MSSCAYGALDAERAVSTADVAGARPSFGSVEHESRRARRSPRVLLLLVLSASSLFAWTQSTRALRAPQLDAVNAGTDTSGHGTTTTDDGGRQYRRQREQREERRRRHQQLGRGARHKPTPIPTRRPYPEADPPPIGRADRDPTFALARADDYPAPSGTPTPRPSMGPVPAPTAEARGTRPTTYRRSATTTGRSPSTTRRAART